MDESRGNWILIIIILISLGILVFLLLDQKEGKKTIDVESISINESNVTMIVGNTYQLLATVMPNSATDTTITWYSENESIVEVKNGVLTAKKVGETNVVAKSSNGKEARTFVKVNAKEVKISKMTISKTDVKMIEGNSLTLSLKINPSNTTEKITWTSSDPAVATVKGGVVTALKEGTTLITAKSTYGKIAICDVEVKRKQIEPTKITLSETAKTLTVGGSITLAVAYEPTNTEARTITWTSSNAGVASVSNGVVKALKEGTAVITAKTINGKTASATITVKAGVRIKVGTLNVGAYHCGTGNINCKSGYSDFVSLISSNSIDIIGLQEAEPQATSNKVATALNYNHYYRNPASADSTMSRYGIISKTYYSLPSCHESRELTKIVVSINGVNISFYNTHLSYQSECPAKQMKKVAEVISSDPNAAILVGDFNVSGSTVLTTALGSRYQIVAHDTSRAIYADSVIIKPKDSAGNTRIKSVNYETKVTRGIYTDHNLVMATLEIVK